MSQEPLAVLVISEQPKLRHALRASLEATGFFVSEACDESDGLQTLDDGFRPCIIVTDLPGAVMKEFHGRLRFRRGLDEVRIISLHDVGQAIGADEEAPKSADYISFENAVRGLMQGSDFVRN